VSDDSIFILLQEIVPGEKQVKVSETFRNGGQNSVLQYWNCLLVVSRASVLKRYIDVDRILN